MLDGLIDLRRRLSRIAGQHRGLRYSRAVEAYEAAAEAEDHTAIVRRPLPTDELIPELDDPKLELRRTCRLMPFTTPVWMAYSHATR
jgi:hypothetical protein